MMPPTIITVHIRAGDRRGFKLWLPVFLVWPFALVLLLVLLPLLLIVDCVLALTRSRVSTLRTVLDVGGVVSALRGLYVDVESRGDGSKVFVEVS